MKKTERNGSVEEAIKRAAKQRDEHSDEVRAEETLKKAMVVLRIKKDAEVQATGKFPDIVKTDMMHVNGHQVQFSLNRKPGESGNVAHYGMFLHVDGKTYTGDDRKSAIIMVDTGKGLTGMSKIKHDSAKAQNEVKKTMEVDAPVLRRTALITAGRAAMSTVVHAEREAVRTGDSIINQLMALLGRTMQGPTR